MEETIRQHYTWTNLRKDVRDYIGSCDTCQRCKKQKKKYGKLPEKQAEATPWELLCVDLVGPYTIQQQNKKS